MKLERELGVKLEELPDDVEESDPQKVFSDLNTVVEKQPGWRVVNDIYLGLFSFTKFTMYKDLEAFAELFAENPLIRTLCGEEIPGEGAAEELFPDPATEGCSVPGQVIEIAAQGDEGAQGWPVSLSVEGPLRITEVTSLGTVSDPTETGGLCEGCISVSHVTSGDDNDGALSSVLLAALAADHGAAFGNREDRPAESRSDDSGERRGQRPDLLRRRAHGQRTPCQQRRRLSGYDPDSHERISHSNRAGQATVEWCTPW